MADMENVENVENAKTVEKKPRDKEQLLELIIAIFLGVKALATAWAGLEHYQRLSGGNPLRKLHRGW